MKTYEVKSAITRGVDMVNNENSQSPAYVTVRQIAEDPSFCFTVPMLRYYILNAHKNGLAPALRRIGRKIVVRKDLWVRWLEEQSARGGSR